LGNFNGNTSGQSFTLSGSAWDSFTASLAGGTVNPANLYWQVAAVDAINSTRTVATTAFPDPSLTPSISTSNLNGFLNNSAYTEGTGYVETFLTDSNGLVTGTASAYRAANTLGNPWSDGVEDHFFNAFPSLNTANLGNSSAYFASFTPNINATNADTFLYAGSFSLGTLTSSSLVLNYDVPAVPEAGTSGMILAGLGMLGFIARRKRSV
jgi:hypothetical protein